MFTLNTPFSPISLKLSHVNHSEFAMICANNPDLSFELTSEGDLIIMSPTGYESSDKNGELFGQIWYWNHQTKLGKILDSSGGITLPNGSIKSPDVTWILSSRDQTLDRQERKKFPLISPDFVIELRSETDNLKTLQAKMQEYIDNGVRLGWLIDPQNKKVEIYRLRQEKEVLDNPQNLSGEDVLPGLVVDLREIFC